MRQCCMRVRGTACAAAHRGWRARCAACPARGAARPARRRTCCGARRCSVSATHKRRLRDAWCRRCCAPLHPLQVERRRRRGGLRARVALVLEPRLGACASAAERARTSDPETHSVACMCARNAPLPPALPAPLANSRAAPLAGWQAGKAARAAAASGSSLSSGGSALQRAAGSARQLRGALTAWRRRRGGGRRACTAGGSPARGTHAATSRAADAAVCTATGVAQQGRLCKLPRVVHASRGDGGGVRCGM